MASPTDKTIPVRFKGITFFVRKQTKVSGRKVAIQEYPGSDVRFVEDLGKIPDVFTIDGFVHGVDDWQDKMNRLSKVLEEKTQGVLEFSFGIVTVKAQNYSAIINETSVGEVAFTITFLKQKDNPSPVNAKNSVQTTSGLAENLLQIVEDSFLENFLIPFVVNNIKTAVYEGTQGVDAIEETASKIQSDISNITSKANSLKNNINSLIKNPDQYSQDLFNSGLIGDLFDLLPLDGTAVEAMVDLTKFGNTLATDFFSIDNNLPIEPVSDYDIPLFEETTVGRINMNKNRKTLVNDIRLSALALLCEQAARANYQTDSDINSVKSKIDTAYTAIVLTNDVDGELGNSLDQARLSSLQVLDGKLQLTPNLVSKDVSNTTNILLAHELYAEQFNNEDDLDKRATEISDLNNELPTKISGKISVFEEDV